MKWTQKTLCAQDYASLRRSGKGLVKRYVEKVTGRSRAQVTRLIDQYVKSGIRQTRRGRGRRFTAHYTAADIALLAEVDEAHETLSGPATRKILYRGYYEFADARFQGWQGFRCRTSTTSASGGDIASTGCFYQDPAHPGIGRGSPPPRARRTSRLHSRGPGASGRSGRAKGVYHINAVDEVTQWQVVGAVERISEAWLEPLREGLLRQFPFRILGFHSDNGSEFINHNVEALLNKLLIAQTKSRPRHANDNGLVESKNGAVIRKHMGFDHIASANADSINVFYESTSIPI